MRKVSYHCDLCKMEFKTEELIGYEWDGYGKAERIKKVAVSSSERHVCKKCARQLREFLKDLTELG